MAGSMKMERLFLVIFLISETLVGSESSRHANIEVPRGIESAVGLKGPSLLEKITEPLRAEYTELVRGSNVFVQAHISSNHIEVFCYKGEQKRLQTFFKTVEAQLEISEPNYRYYEASNASEVRRLYSDSSWFSFSPWKPTAFRFDLYNESCIGLETAESYRVSLRIRFVDVWRVLFVLGGVLLFAGAGALSRNLLFHYASASLLGILCSFIILLLLVARYIPKKSGALTFMLGGSGLFLYLLQLLYTNFVFLINQYYAVFLGYIAVTGLVSFGVMYRSGGLSDGRSLQLLQWSLQCCGLLAVYFSSQYREATLALVLLLLLHHNTPAAVSNTLKSVWRRRFPPKVQLLTEEEFLQQGNLVTTEALHSLRDHCKSPDCNAWRTMSRLNTPLRFAEFVEGSSHLQDEELLHYELSQYSDSNHRTPPRLTDDEDDLTDDGDY